MRLPTSFFSNSTHCSLYLQHLIAQISKVALGAGERFRFSQSICSKGRNNDDTHSAQRSFGNKKSSSSCPDYRRGDRGSVPGARPQEVGNQGLRL